MVHAAIYPRQSVEKKDSLSIEQQVQLGINLCNVNGWQYKIYDKDKGYSGKNLNRPSFEELMADVRAGKINKIICYKFDRVSRNISDFSSLMVELQSYNCEFVSISENFDTTTPIGRAMVYICMVFAQMERENTSQRVHDNYYYRMDLGFWGGGPAPYGYKLNRVDYKGQSHTVLEPDAAEADIVRKMYDWYLEPNNSVSKILNTLNVELKIPTRKGAQWTSRVIVDILTRPLYAPNDMKMYNYLRNSGAQIANSPAEFDGNLSVDLYGKKDANSSKHKRCRDISDMYCNISNHAPIVDSDIWIKVQFKHKALTDKPRRSGSGRNSYFTGLMKCACCGRGVSYTMSRGCAGYYICSTRKNKGWDSCDMPPASKAKADPAILRNLLDHYQDPDIIAKLHSAAIPESTKSISAIAKEQKNNLMAKMAVIDQNIENLISSLQESGAVSAKYINQRLEKLDAEKSEIELALIELDESNYTENEEQLLARKIEGCISTIPEVLSGNDFDSIKNLCAILIKEIKFNKDSSISITYAI